MKIKCFGFELQFFCGWRHKWGRFRSFWPRLLGLES